MKGIYFALMCSGAGNGNEEIRAFATRDEAERALSNARINEFDAKYWIDEKPVVEIQHGYIVTRETSGGKWQARPSDSQRFPATLRKLREFDTREAAVEAVRLDIESAPSYRVLQIEVVTDKQ